jgi:hypothetical protein
MAAVSSLLALASASRDAGAVLLSVSQRVSRLIQRDDASETCAVLNNKGTHFTIDIEVGTPGQTFGVVADTGSNSLIVPSCVCNEDGACGDENRCFRGTNHSSTFSIESGTEGAGPTPMMLSFGSGTIEAVVARDVVRLGELRVQMKDGLLLMTDQALDIPGRFEGILGLGIPDATSLARGAEEKDEKEVGKNGSSIARQVEEAPQEMMVNVSGLGGSPEAAASQSTFGRILRGIFGKLGAATKANQAALEEALGRAPAEVEAENATAADEIHQPKGFLEQARVDRFSMCFLDGADGVLRLNPAPQEKAHGSIGQAHWGLDFRGVSVGNHSVGAAFFCNGTNLEPGQRTPCGAIPDSGTTAFMGPEAHVTELLDEICDRWPRCAENYTALAAAAKAAKAAAISHYKVNPFESIKAGTKADVLNLLLKDCQSWLNESDGLDEMPPIYFHVAGSNGTNQTLKIPGYAYVIERKEEELDYVYKHIDGLGDIPLGVNHTGRFQKVCTPAFGAMEYNTKENGPVWILGTPIFYEYIVGYDLAPTPPSIVFTSVDEEPCGSCNKDIGLVSTSNTSALRADSSRVSRQPRKVHGKFRRPSIDVRLPL